jgi:large subunit ribosomal protein L4
MKAKVITLENKAAGDIDLNDAVFGIEVRRDILARMVNYQRAKRRAGTHKVKTRGEIAGTTAPVRVRSRSPRCVAAAPCSARLRATTATS